MTGLIAFIMVLAMVLLYLFLIVYGVAAYVIQGVTCLKIAKKLGVPGGFMGFIPGACYWLLGRLAEEDDRIYHPEKKGVKWSVWFLVSLGAYVVLAVVGYIVMYFASFFATISQSIPQQTEIVLLCVVLIGDLIMLAGVLVYLVVYGIVFYKICHALAGKSAVWMLILSLFVPFAQLIIMLMLAFKDEYSVAAPAEELLAQENFAEQTIEEN